MMIPKIFRPVHIGNFAFCCLVVAMVTYMMFYVIGISTLLREGPEHSTAIVMIDESVSRPYVYRTLFPTLGHVITNLTPEVVRQAVGQTVLAVSELPVIQEFMSRAKWTDYNPVLASPQYLYPLTVLFLLMYAAFLVYAVTLHKSFQACFPGRPCAAKMTTLLGLVILFPFITHVFKIYDPPTLAFSALCLYFMFTQQWVPYFVVFTLSCVNKETTILQTGFFAMAFLYRMPRRQYLLLLLGQLAIFMTIKLAINFIYDDSPGMMLKYRNVWVVAVASRKIVAANVLWLVVATWLITAHWREIPMTLRHSLWVLAGCVLVYYILGAPGEYRVFLDAFPGITLIAGYTMFRKLDAPPNEKAG